MQYLNPYFSNLVFSRIEDKQGYTIYGAGINTGIAGGFHRYVLLFVPSHLAVLSKAKINELGWTNLQTRQLRDSYRLRPQNFKITRNLPDIELNIISRDNKQSTYTASNFPFEIVLLHNQRKKSQYQYNNKIMLSSALETFNCVITYLGEMPSSDYSERYGNGEWQDPEIDDSFQLL